MKLISPALLIAVATFSAGLLSAQTPENWQKTAVQKHPALAQAGSPFNQRFLAFVAEKRKAEPAYFAKADWPMRAADAVAAALRAEESAAKAKAKAEDKRTPAERERDEEIAKWEQEWEAAKARWIFDRLVFGDSEEVIVRKLGLSKTVAARTAGTTRVDLNSRFRWVLGESKFNLEFELKDGLAAITFDSRPESTEELDTLIREDWDKLRAAALDHFGPPTKSAEFPKAEKLRRGAWTVTDVWEQPGRIIGFGLNEDAGKCRITLRISDPARGATAPPF